MKKTLLLIGSFICVSSIVTKAQTIYPSGVSGCVGRWTFDEKRGLSPTQVMDESGNNNHGTNNNIVATAGWKGIPNTAGAFNGTSSWGEVTHHSTLNCPSEITMISLIKFNNFNNQKCQNNQILSKGYPHFISGNYGIGVGDAAYDNDCFVYTPSKTQLFSQIGNGILSPPAGNYLDLNKWYFLATTITPTTVKNYVVYMDPNTKQSSIQAVDNINGSINIGINTQNISIGRHLNPEYQYHVNGDMDELILFNRALSDTEVYSVYDFLYGATTSISKNTKDKDNFIVSAQNGQCFITSKSSKFSYAIYNSIGQAVASKNNCKNSEIIDLGHHATQMLFVKIQDEKNQTHSFKINLLN